MVAAQPEGATAELRQQVEQQIEELAKVLLEEFGGPTRSEGAVDMAIRVLREQRAALASHEAQIQAEAYEAAAKLVCWVCRAEGMPDEKGNHGAVARVIQFCLAWPIPAVAAALRGK